MGRRVPLLRHPDIDEIRRKRAEVVRSFFIKDGEGIHFCVDKPANSGEQEEIRKFYTQIQQRLTKYEEEIRAKKQGKIQRNKYDYANAPNLTFRRRFGNAVREYKTVGGS
ncbi:hypothetical protein NDU88_002100 [Pleurodeles waltl]|uniref:Uncharacterized protein n=1 Tax=Pleurodeles waltl TaxID=8319 RepID=A0AAV7P8Q7_PLEWA|nr:hypothetical protein NDU88_002100 [Pleurodeles waltl]